jgi:hypothetical protein
LVPLHAVALGLLVVQERVVEAQVEQPVLGRVLLRGTSGPAALPLRALAALPRFLLRVHLGLGPNRKLRRGHVRLVLTRLRAATRALLLPCRGLVLHHAAQVELLEGRRALEHGRHAVERVHAQHLEERGLRGGRVYERHRRENSGGDFAGGQHGSVAGAELEQPRRVFVAAPGESFARNAAAAARGRRRRAPRRGSRGRSGSSVARRSLSVVVRWCAVNGVDDEAMAPLCCERVPGFRRHGRRAAVQRPALPAAQCAGQDHRFAPLPGFQPPEALLHFALVRRKLWRREARPHARQKGGAVAAAYQGLSRRHELREVRPHLRGGLAGRGRLGEGRERERGFVVAVVAAVVPAGRRAVGREGGVALRGQPLDIQRFAPLG